MSMLRNTVDRLLFSSSPLRETPVDNEFTLDEEFITSYNEVVPQFGFSGLGELVYYRSYSRPKDDYTGDGEHWVDTIKRVTEGTYAIQQSWICSQNLDWKPKKAQKSGQEMFRRMFDMKFLPPGRGLWAMGSALTKERKLYAPLNNCAFISTKDLAKDCSYPFTFLMDASMLGIGTGFDVKGANTIMVHGPDMTKPVTQFIIPDSREGWVESVRLLIESYLIPGRGPMVFDSRLVRPKGSPIVGFGGVASGPESLHICHEFVEETLRRDIGHYISITTIVDIMNHIGVCVVSGNVRRTAEIGMGPIEDEFMDLKNYDLNPHRADYGWTSNNTVFAELGMDYSGVCERIMLNGEPGLAWLSNMQKNGRMDGTHDKTDTRALGCNPCVPGNTLIATAEGPRAVSDLIGVPFDAVIDKKSYHVVDGFFHTGKRMLYYVETVGGYYLKLTADHQVQCCEVNESQYTDNGVEQRGTIYWKKASQLTNKDHVVLNNTTEWTHWGGCGSHAEGYLTAMFLLHGTCYEDTDKVFFEFKKASESLVYVVREYLEQLSVPDVREVIFMPSGTTRVAKIVSYQLIHVLRKMGAFNLTTHDVIDPLPVLSASSDFQRGFLSGIVDANGDLSAGCSGSDPKVVIKSLRRDHLPLVQRCLMNFGIVSRVATRSPSNGVPRITPRFALEIRNSSITQLISIVELHAHENMAHMSHMEDVVGVQMHYEQLSSKPLTRGLLPPYRWTPPRGNYNNEQFYDRVYSIHISGEVVDVYDCQVPGANRFGANGIMVHNCGEQTLESGELCCLVETFPHRHETLEDFLVTLKYAYLYAKTVTLGNTHWPKSNVIMMRNRRIGCSMSGIAQFLAARGIDELIRWCRAGYDTIQRYDAVYSEWFAIPRSIKTTSIKPSGTVSLLAGATPGMHYPIASTYIRRARIPIDSDFATALREAGYAVVPAIGSETTTAVVEFPISEINNIRKVTEVSLWEQMKLAAVLQEHWSDNQVSCTVTFNPETEGHQIKHALDYFQYELKGISFLPNRPLVYPQLPYEEITREEYELRSANLKRVDYRKAVTNAKLPEAERFCDGDQCVL
jgi:ribonucleotide reductase alpha subunit